MIRVDEGRGARFARVALPAALTALLVALAGLAAVVLVHVRAKREIVDEALRRPGSAERALREIAPIIGDDVVLASAALIVAIAAALAIATGYRAYSQTRRRLRELKVFAADVLESVATGIVTLDLDGRVTAINGRAARLLGIDRERTLLPYGDVFAAAPVLCEAAERLLERRAPFRNLEVAAPPPPAAPGEPPEDAPRTLSVDGSFLETEAGERIGAVIQVSDVTEQRCIEREVRRSEQLAALGTLAAGVAHEIRNPLAALDINLQLLHEALGGGRAPEETERYLRVIEAELRRLDGIVENFIRFARSSPLERGPVALGPLIEETLALVAPECERHRVRLVREGVGGAHPPALAAEGEVKQALLNIVLNAIQAMPGGGTLAVSLSHGPSRARIAVRDSGPGIPERIRDRVFDVFVTTREDGTGLGLPIAKRIVEAHGGEIAFETGEGGTTFTVTLPLAVAEAPAAAATPIPAAAAAGAGA
jgi:signal transduction histidine kinase